MKSALSLGFILMALFTANAQSNIPKGSILLGGNFSFSNYTYKWDNQSHETTGYSISPTIGKAIKDNLFIGLYGGVGFSKNSNNTNTPYIDSTRSSTYSYGMLVRKYKPIRNNFYLFLQGNLGGNNAKTKFKQNSMYDIKSFSIDASLSPGISYGISNKLHIETGFNSILGLGYSSQEYSGPSLGTVRKQTGFNLYTNLSNFNSQFYMGFRLLLQKKNRTESAVKQG